MHFGNILCYLSAKDYAGATLLLLYLEREQTSVPALLLSIISSLSLYNYLIYETTIYYNATNFQGILRISLLHLYQTEFQKVSLIPQLPVLW